jgi:Protein of unknown function (DUF3500)
MTQTATATLDARREAATRMAEAAGRFLEALSPEQSALGRRPFEDAERVRWFYTPTTQAGVPMLLLDARQQQLGHQLVASGLSLGAYNTASTIMGLENTLDSREGWRQNPYHGWREPSRNRDPQKYFICVYGEPGAARWGWRFGGHHISLNFTITDGALLSPTPTFFGADPADSAGVGPNSLRPLAGEEDLARQLLHSLDPGQRTRATLSGIAPPDLIQANRSRVEDGALWLPLFSIFSSPVDTPEAMQRAVARMEEGLTDADREQLRYSAAAPKGLPASAMSGGQRGALETLVRQYIYRLPDDVAEAEWQALAERGVDVLHFAWAGGSERKEPHYYRIQGPRLLVEYDNVQNGANHIHSVWRDPSLDFGGDPLTQHHRVAHSA